MTGRSIAALLACLVLVACGGSGGSEPNHRAGTETTSTTPAPSSDAPTVAKPGTEIILANSEFGPMLFSKGKQAIYLFDVETTDKPKCYGDCAEAWPPVLTDGEPVAGGGVKESLLGTTERSDGTTQVTYGDHPLYYYAHEGPGEVECHNIFLNGGTWYVVKSNGNRA